MALYILKSTICLTIFLVFYKLFLEKQHMHVFKRFYLLGSLIIAFSIPLITFTTYIEPISQITTESELLINPIDDFNLTNEINIVKATNYSPIILWSIYLLGVLIFGINFIRNLYRLFHKINNNIKHINSKTTNVLLKENVMPHTFLRYVFFNKYKFESKGIPKEVFWHEETHAVQKHSLDIIFIELLQVILWFNPLIYLIKNSIKLNHEFLADLGVLNKGVQPNIYQQLLLEFSSNKQEYQFSNAFNYSSIKKRFTIMKTQTSKRTLWLRILFILPILALSLFSFSNKVEIEKNKLSEVTIDLNNESENNINTSLNTSAIIEEVPQQKILQKKRVNSNKVPTPDEYYAGVRFIYYNKSIRYNDTLIGMNPTINKLHKDLTLAEKKKIPLSNYVPSPSPIRTTSKEEIIEISKKPKVFLIRIDGVIVPNSKLSKYSPEDFGNYSGRLFIHKTGRKKHPQAFWVHFYTHEYLKKNPYVQPQKYPEKESITYGNVKRVRKNFKDK